MITPTKDEFFQRMWEMGIALTFDDVRTATGLCQFDHNKVDLESRFSRRVQLKIPIASAAMDTVTEERMAIELAKLGGIGIIHKNLDPETQYRQVRAVKLHLNARVESPVCVSQDQTVADVLQTCEERGHQFRSFPVLDNDQRLVGILTSRNIDLCTDKSGLVRKSMTRRVISVPESTTPEQALHVMEKHQIKAVPVVDDDHQVTGLYLSTDVQRILSGNVPHNVDKHGRLIVGAAVGVGDRAVERAKLLAKRLDVIVIDTAHGDNTEVFKTYERIKQEIAAEIDVVVGNISEYSSAKRLAEMNVDGIKVGQGPGSICTTREIAGVGTPQVTAIYGCTKAVRDVNKDIPICGDGGIRKPGDITIAIAAGADSVMLGNILARTDEAPGEFVQTQKGKRKHYRGMGSRAAMLDNEGSRERYNELGTTKDTVLAEGVSGSVPYEGSLVTVIHRHVEGLRRGMGYTGSPSISVLQHNTTFWRMTEAGKAESAPHDISDITG